MRKNIFILATVALFASCSNTDSLKEIVTPDEEIGFATFTSKQTRGTTADEASENNGSTTVNVLENYNTTFKVWGSKFIGTDETRIFGTNGKGDIVSWISSDSKWTYSPVRFWDKSATSYSFYAASPSKYNWGWDNTNKTISLDNFAVSGTNRVTATDANSTAAFGVSTTINADAIMSKDDEDLMISNDVTNYKTYTNANVNLHFNHILSRLNIGVRKATILDDFEVRLKSIMVYNMKSNGKFDEHENAAVSSGTIARWVAPSGTQTKFTNGVGYKFDNATDFLEVTSTESAQTATYQYVYQGLVIPQAVAYNPTVEVNNYTANQTPAQFRLDGQDKGASANPYIMIKYEIWTKPSTYTAAEADEYNTEHNLLSGDEGFKSQGDTKPAEKMDGYEYYYNLADVFNGEATDAVNFCEGWQNTLKITLAPVAINFDADVYEWTTDANQDVYVTEKPANNQQNGNGD